MPTYRWRCLACETPNAPEASYCIACGCPAEASGFEIERHSPTPKKTEEKIAMWRIANYSLAIFFILLASLFTQSLLAFVAALASVAYLTLCGGYQIHQSEVDVPLIAGNSLAILCWVLFNSPIGGDFMLIGLLLFGVLVCMLCGIATWAKHTIARRKLRLSVSS